MSHVIQRQAPPQPVPQSHSSATPLARLREAIEHAAHYLPAQGPITVFIHHNTLHAFEDYTFDEGVQRGAELLGCEPYLAEERYRAMLHQRRIQTADLDAVLLEDLGDEAEVLLGFMGTRFQLRQAMLRYALQDAPPAELDWFIAETDALNRFRRDVSEDLRWRFIEETRHWILRDQRNGNKRRLARGAEPTLHDVLLELIDHFGRNSMERWNDATWETFSVQALWRICQRGVRCADAPSAQNRRHVRHRDFVLLATGCDIDQLVHEELIPFCAAFLDQGLSSWPLPERESGFLAAFSALHRRRSSLSSRWLSGLSAELARWNSSSLSPLEAIQESLEVLGVPEEEWDDYLIATLLALRGWAGMVWQLEVRGDRVAHPAPAGSLIEYLAVRLLLERLALTHVVRGEFGRDIPVAELRGLAHPPEAPHEGADRRTFQVFQLAQVLGWLPPALAQLSPREWSMVVREVEAFPALQRRRLLHRAFERRYRIETLDALSVHAAKPHRPAAPPRFQVVTCIDEREESFRRHLEEVAPQAETFGVAGFFGVAIYYRGVSDAHFVPLCPVVIRPQHWVTESAVDAHVEVDQRNRRRRRTLGAASHQVHQRSRTFLGGAVVAGLGVLASIPLVARVLFPRSTARLRRHAAELITRPPRTELRIERTEPEPGAEPGHIGYAVQEMAQIVQRTLSDIGLTRDLARLVFIVGHGSSSLNNPHESAHDCGACGGGRGGPNARAFAMMANDPRVRERLAAAGLTLPEETLFVGAYHNTCDESLTFYDLDSIPASHAEELDAALQAMNEARQRNAHERCRRFESAPLNLPTEAALRHVEARAEDLSQVRPEYGHATNAVCVVGRRERTRGLYMDRRAFLVSYDPYQDDADQTILTRILQAVIPVCGGISLEYYFSFVDNVGFGCGTKLPHNITSLLGVMDGAASDLRPGLPWQMVEIHDPVRLLFVIESTPEAVNRIFDRNPGLAKLCRNDWVQVATLAPDSTAIHILRGDQFLRFRPASRSLPQASSSIDWYRGWRDHLGYAVIDAND